MIHTACHTCHACTCQTLHEIAVKNKELLSHYCLVRRIGNDVRERLVNNETGRAIDTVTRFLPRLAVIKLQLPSITKTVRCHGRKIVHVT
jgi:hypothetical protein